MRGRISFDIRQFAQRHHVLQKIASGERVWWQEIFWQISQQSAGAGFMMRNTENLDCTAMDIAKIQQAFNSGRLARAVLSDQPEALTPLHRET